MLKEKVKKSKGITLIALIITIIILLILLAVGIDIAMDGQIFNIAEDAVNKTNHKVGEVQNEVYDLEDEMDDIKQWACQHTFGEWVIIKEATETETGTRERVCSKCGYIQRETIPALAKEIPEITLSYSTEEWTKDDVVVTASANKSGYTIQMSKDGTNWESGNTLTYEANGDVYARAMKDGSQVGSTVEGEVTNIDKTPPTVGTIKGYEDIDLQNEWGFEIDQPDTILYVSNDLADMSTLSMYIEFINGSDNGSGMHKTTYKITSTGSTINDEWEKFYAEYVFDDSNTSLPIIKLDMMGGRGVVNPYVTLEEWSDYMVEVVSEDKLGNVSEATYYVNLYVYGVSWG